MQDDPAKAFDLLYGALCEYVATFVDTSMKGCGFFLVALGWVLTSDQVHAFVEKDPANLWLAVFGFALPSIAAVVMATRVIRTTAHLGRELDALQYFPRAYYGYRALKLPFAIAVIFVAISPCIVAIAFLISMHGKKADVEEVSKHECVTVVQSGARSAPKP
jgi:hypothetical protein